VDVVGSRGKVAIPYYGCLVRPMDGFESLYFLADLDWTPDCCNRVELEVWNHKVDPELGVWLKGKGVEGVVCSDETCECGRYLSRLGIWVKAGMTGDVYEVLEKCCAERLANMTPLCGDNLTRLPRKD